MKEERKGEQRETDVHKIFKEKRKNEENRKNEKQRRKLQIGMPGRG